MTQNADDKNNNSIDTQKPTQAPVPVVPVYAYPPLEDEVSLIDLFLIFYRRKWLMFLIFFISVAAAYGITRTMPRLYTAQATLMPVSNSGGSGAGAMMAQLSSIPLLGEKLGGLGDEKGKELINILESRHLSEAVIQRFDLMPILFEDQWDPVTKTFFKKFMKDIPVLEDGVKVFQKKVASFEVDKKSGLLTLEVTLKDPVLAAKITNAMIIGLQDFINKNSLTVEKRNRLFVEKQLVENRADLLEVGKSLGKFYANNKISSVLPKLDVEVGSFETLPETFEEFQRLVEGVEEIKRPRTNKKETKYVKNVPSQVYLEYLMLKKELLVETHSLLTQQFKLAEIEEIKEDLGFQIIDEAKVPYRPSSPKLILNLIIGVGAGIFFAFFLVFCLEFWSRLKIKASANSPH